MTDFDPTKHGYDASTEIGDFAADEAYEMGTSDGKAELSAELFAALVAPYKNSTQPNSRLTAISNIITRHRREHA